MRAAELVPGVRVRVEVPAARVTFGVTRVHVRVWSGTVLGPVAFEPGMLRVRPEGTAGAVRVLLDHVSVLEPAGVLS